MASGSVQEAVVDAVSPFWSHFSLDVQVEHMRIQEQNGKRKKCCDSGSYSVKFNAFHEENLPDI